MSVKKLTMNKKIIKKLEEGGGGLLYAEYENGSYETISPHYSLHVARELLLRFYNQKTEDDLLIKNSFMHNGVNYFPSCISLLYWNFFYGYTRYENVLNQVTCDELEIKEVAKNGYGGFGFIFNRLIDFSAHPNSVKTLLRRHLRSIFWTIVKIRNKFLIRTSDRTILFLRESFVDFRSQEILSELKNHYKVIEASWPTKRDFLFKFFNFNLLFCGPGTYKKIFNKEILHNNDSKLNDYAILYANDLVNQRIAAEYFFEECISNKKFLCMVGMDDCNYAYPVIYACRKKGIPTVGIQHAFYCDHHEAYVMRGIDDHLWYENLLVYGQYWKEMFLKHNKIFNSDNVLVCRNKSKYNYQISGELNLDNNAPLSILLIYEFLADTLTIGKYIEGLMDLGHKIYFKIRPDETLLNQLKAYGLNNSLTAKWSIVDKINEDLMTQIDVVVGTYSTMLFDLYPFGKRILRFDTVFELNNDSLEGYALKCSFADLGRFRALADPDAKDQVAKMSSQLNGDVPISEIIHRIIERAEVK